MDIDPKHIGAEVKRRRELVRVDGKPMTQEQLAERSGVGQSTIGRIENGEFSPRRLPPSLYQLAEAMGLSVTDFGVPEAGSAPRARPSAGAILSGDKFAGSVSDFPVHASAEGGRGEIIVDSQPVDFIPRPSVVANVRGAYGLIVVGTSMEPEFEAGDMAIVNPNLPVIAGSTYVFYAEKDGTARATIKRLRRATTDTWQVRQWNPPDGEKNDFTLSRREWGLCHRVLGKHYR